MKVKAGQVLRCAPFHHIKSTKIPKSSYKGTGELVGNYSIVNESKELLASKIW
jgi:hypothetical protein